MLNKAQDLNTIKPLPYKVVFWEPINWQEILLKIMVYAKIGNLIHSDQLNLAIDQLLTHSPRDHSNIT